MNLFFMVKDVFKVFKENRERKYWHKRQMAYLRQQLREDSQWLASDKVSSELIKRYLEMASDDYYKNPVEPIYGLRTRLGLDPVLTPAKKTG